MAVVISKLSGAWRGAQEVHSTLGLSDSLAGQKVQETGTSR